MSIGIDDDLLDPVARGDRDYYEEPEYDFERDVYRELKEMEENENQS